MSADTSFSPNEFRLKWVDDTHALGIFASSRQGTTTLQDLLVTGMGVGDLCNPHNTQPGCLLRLPSTSSRQGF